MHQDRSYVHTRCLFCLFYKDMRESQCWHVVRCSFLTFYMHNWWTSKGQAIDRASVYKVHYRVWNNDCSTSYFHPTPLHLLPCRPWTPSQTSTTSRATMSRCNLTLRRSKFLLWTPTMILFLLERQCMLSSLHPSSLHLTEIFIIDVWLTGACSHCSDLCMRLLSLTVPTSVSRARLAWTLTWYARFYQCHRVRLSVSPETQHRQSV